MAASRISSAKQQRTWGFTTALASAVLEWLLILFLLVNAIFSFLVTKFARCCKLQTPCLLCSRLDHVFGSKTLGYYWELICGNHKLEISSLVLCHAHNKLVDVHGMCETCFFSFATINKSNAETYRLLVGKLGEDTLCGFDQDPKICSSDTRHCSCCSEPWVLRNTQKLIQTKSVGCEAAELDVPLSGEVELNQDDWKMRRGKPPVSVRATNLRNSGIDSLSHVGYTELKVTSDTESEVLYSDDDNDASALLRATDVSKDDLAVQDVQLEPLIITLADDSATEKLIIADSAPEAFSPVSQVELDSIEVHGSTSVASTAAVKNGLEELNWQQAVSMASSPAPTDLLSLDYVTPSSNTMETTIKVSKQSYLTGTGEGGQTTVVECGKINDARTTPIMPSEIGLETNPVSSDTAQLVPNLLDLGDAYKMAVGSRGRQSSGVFVEQWVGKDNSRVSEDLKLLLSQLSATRGIEQSMNDKSPIVSVNGDESKTSVAECGKINDARTTPIMSSEIGLETKPVSSDTAQLVPNLLDLGDAYQMAVGSRGRQLSGVLAEQWVGKDNSRVSEDVKLLLSQLSATRGIEQSMSDKSPRVSVNSDESKTADASSSIGMQILQKRISPEQNESGLLLDGIGSTLQKRISLERNESGLSLDGSTLQKRISLERNESGLSLDGSIVSEIEGENMVDRLKRQIEHDRKHMSALYKELEEERNASAVAVNQAMAMITKLQEEKATLHMEALQCLRLMEEQSEYDMEALQKANDLLAEKEKEIQDLEDELEFNRNMFPNESISENVVEETCGVKARDIGMDRCESVCVEDSARVLRDSVTEELNICDKVEGAGMPLGDKDTGTVKNALLELEDDRLYILQCLKKLEKKLYSFSNNGEYLANGEYQVNEGGDGKSEFKESNLNGRTQGNGGVEEDDLSVQNYISVSRTNLQAQASFESSQPLCKENMKFDSSGQGSPVPHWGADLASLGNVVSELNGRLEVLEADRTFLEHAIKSVGNGEEGLQLVREIASHLQELRRIGIRRIDPTIA
ncbi:myosin-binding protein 1-like isoform X2 [Alnus glutinosa]|uniref:myosin-binding protein 1-like isoform X2 n=1 Tax=Alnus glutinosa TaxID=3517 RepID=UPI002D799A26|nr:myosin-binding protein 1-like isoform X2 [Alnus glutinosa]